MTRINLRQLEVFRVVMEKGSVTEAAKSLSVTQPAVSKTLVQLEATFGVLLFGRSHGRLHPTGDARRLYAETNSVFNQIERFEQRILRLRDGWEGKLVVSAIPTLAMSVVASTIARFVEERPQVRIDLFSENADRVVDDVTHNRVDLGFVHLPLSTGPLRQRVIGESEMLCVLHREHPLSAHKTLTPAMLADQPLIFLDKLFPPSHLVHECFAQAGVSPHVVIEVNLSVAAKTMARIGRGIAIIDPWPLIIDPTPDLVMRPFRPRVPLRIVCLHSPDRPLSRVAEFLVQQLGDTIARTKDSKFARTKN